MASPHLPLRRDEALAEQLPQSTPGDSTGRFDERTRLGAHQLVQVVRVPEYVEPFPADRRVVDVPVGRKSIAHQPERIACDVTSVLQKFEDVFVFARVPAEDCSCRSRALVHIQRLSCCLCPRKLRSAGEPAVAVLLL